jgi:uncharacterized damage-inducible protein DinB
MKRSMALVAMMACLVAVSATAHGDADHAHEKGGTMEKRGVKAEWTKNLDTAAGHIVELAEAMPEDKYSWRPAEGVRSFGEAILHAAAANYQIPTYVGIKAPEGMKLMEFETSMTKKADIIAAYKKSVEHMKAGVYAMADADFDTQATWFLGEGSKREILFFTAAHDHEHLGQLIAYARMNGVAPPWSKKQG